MKCFQRSQDNNSARLEPFNQHTSHQAKAMTVSPTSFMSHLYVCARARGLFSVSVGTNQRQYSLDRDEIHGFVNIFS